jgi:hypothetical protein
LIGAEPDCRGWIESETVIRVTIPKLVYFVHDLSDPAVSRRLAMLQPYLVAATVIGFHRSGTAPDRVGGWPAVSLGRTGDGLLGQRLLSVLRVRTTIGRLRAYMTDATVIMARQLEMLVLARAARSRFAADATLIYECLDIHRLMVTPSLAGAALRWSESRLLRQTDLLIVSSPAFLREHLDRIHAAALPPSCLIENKVMQAEIAAGLPAGCRPDGPPWRIGWYGVLRCRRSLQLLIDLTQRLPGQIVVELRGRPAYSAIPDFDALVESAPGVHFLGTYDRQHDLDRIYKAVHFTWAIDFFEDGANSEWLLPNRLYEGGAHGAVPIALATVETGRWLAREATGILLEQPIAENLLRYFAGLTRPVYMQAVQSLMAVPRDRWVDGGADGVRLAEALLRHRYKA